MKSSNSNGRLLPGLFPAMLLAAGTTAWSADAPVALKEVFKDHFVVGTAVDRSMVTGGAGFRRSAEQNAADLALLKQQFNQITAENDTKWQLIHPREGAEGYDFGPTDALAMKSGPMISDQRELRRTLVPVPSARASFTTSQTLILPL